MLRCVQYKIRLIGSGFSDVPEEITLRVAGQRLGTCGTSHVRPCAILTTPTSRELSYTIEDDGMFYGRHKVPVSVIVDEKESNPVEIRLSRVRYSVPLSVAFFGAVALATLLVFLSSALKANPAVPPVSRWDAFFSAP